MKKYLVSYKTGDCCSYSAIVETPEDYVPCSDNMLKIKKQIVDLFKPTYETLMSPPGDWGGYIQFHSGDRIKAEELNILAISRLDL